MVLIDPDVLQRLKENVQSPESSMMKTLETEMLNTLQMKQLSDEERWLRYSALFHRYQFFFDKSKKPIAINIQENPPPQDIDTDTQHSKPAGEEGDELKKQVLAVLPKRKRHLGELLYNHLSKHPEKIQWNGLGQVSIDKTEIPHSSIIDLISNTVRDKRNTHPTVWGRFAQAITELNIPQEYISTQRRGQQHEATPQQEQVFEREQQREKELELEDRPSRTRKRLASSTRRVRSTPSPPPSSRKHRNWSAFHFASR
jgi:hypothetical protein